MSIRRAVPDLTSTDLARTCTFCRDVLGFAVGMHLGLVVNLVSMTSTASTNEPPSSGVAPPEGAVISRWWAER